MRLALREVWAGPPGEPEPVLRGISLELSAGEWVALDGPNGCGKSTLLMVAAGLRPPSRGERVLEAGPAPPRRAGPHPRLATILQDPSVQLLQPTVAEEIGLTALHLGASATEVESAVERWSGVLGLGELLERAPQTLSAGRQQLVLLAAALASEPDFLIADEPGAHLDEEARARTLEAVRAEVRRGMGVLWATQDPRERRAADRVLSLGGQPASAPDRNPAPLPDPGPSVLRILVTAETGAEGPCVRTAGEFEISLFSRGVTALVGANGAGKSVLLRCATGLSTCPQVRLEMSGRWDRPPLMVSQYPEREIFEDTVAREIAYAATRRGLSRGEAKARAVRELSRFGFDGDRFLLRRTWELSAGEKRVVLLVAGLIAPAGLLALDEPTAGLDPGRREALERAVLERSEIGPVLVAGQDREWLGGLGAAPRSVPPGQELPSPSKKTD